MSRVTIPPELLPYLLHEKQDNSSVQHSIVTVNSVFLALIWVTTGLRFWVRFRMLRSAGLDDMALMFATLLLVSSLIGESFGLGKHIWNLSPNDDDIPGLVGKVTKSLFGAYLSYSTAITFTKFSIMATYVRIFPHGFLRKTVYGTAVVVLCFWIASIFAIIFTCVPVRAAWDYDVEGKCFPIVNFFYASSALNIVADILLCCLPVPTLWALNLPKGQRTILIVLFSMGTFACVASILRLTHLSGLGGGVDITYQTVSSLNWSVVEVDMGIVCASLSALRPLAKRFVPNLFSQSSRSSSPTEKPLVTSTTQQSIPFQSRFQPPPAKILSFNAIVSSPIRPKRPERPARSSSIGSTRSEIYVQKTFEVQTMKDLPNLPDPLRSHSRISHVGEMIQRPAPQNIVSRTECQASTEHVENMTQIQIPQRISSVGKGRGKAIEEMSDSEVMMATAALKWPTRTLTKGKHERKDSQSRPNVVGMFTANLLDFTSSEDEGLATGRSSTESEDTIREQVRAGEGSRS